MEINEHIKTHALICEQTRARLKDQGRVGPWDEEADRVEFDYLGLKCLALRNPQFLTWCGYVALPRDHKYFGVDYRDISVLSNIRVHGGLAYSRKCNGPICHIADEGDDVWWVGFDCAHGMDLVPAVIPLVSHNCVSFSSYHGEYRNQDYVIKQIKKLADRLVEPPLEAA